MGDGGQPDWINSFLDHTSGIPSPEVFRLWAGIATLAGALERRVWVKLAGKAVYPNMYTLLVGVPATGKSQAIEHTNELWHAIAELKLAPHDITKASLVDNLEKASRKLVMPTDNGGTQLLEYNSLLVAADEFGVLVPSHDLEFLSTLNRIYDNPPQHRQDRRSLKTPIDITNPQINIIAGVQPAYLANLLPDEAWAMGFMSRVVMVYASQKQKVKLFGANQLTKQANQVLIRSLRDVTKLYGQMDWEDAAALEFTRWYEDGCEPVPEHSRLEHYIGRRPLHVAKLAIVAAVSAGRRFISFADFTRARDWLLSAELRMPDVFREMIQKSDIQVITELHFFAWQLWVKDKKPIHESRLINFLTSRTPSERIPRILEVCSRANIFDRDAGTSSYRPRPKNEHGLE
jgi:hypothetical protein